MGNEDSSTDAGRRRSIGCIVTIGALAILVVIVGIIASSSGSPDCVDLSMRASLQDGTNIFIYNDDTFYWEDVKIYIDGVIDGYRLNRSFIEPGGERVFPLREFVNSDGVRYNPVAWKPRTIFVSVTIRKGEEDETCGSMSGNWE